MNLADDDEIIGMQIDTQGDSLLIVSELGYGKRTELSEFHLQKRGGKGVKCYKIMEKTGDVVGVKAVTNDNEIMMITDQGVIIQLRMEDIKIISRITSGVKMITLDKGVKVAKIAKVREKISDGDRDIDMEDIDDVVINVAKSDEPVVVIHDEIDVDDDEEDTRFDGIEDE
jgi:DNA gyrase subunit A